MHEQKLFTIPAGLSFVDSLAQGLWRKAGEDPLALSEMTVMLPTRRAVRAAREAFLRLGDGKPLLLPSLRAIGDVDEEEIDLQSNIASFSGDSFELPPAISSTRRQFLLTLAVQKLPTPSGEARSVDQSARLAGELARLLDQAHNERLSFSQLAELVPSDLAEHWQTTLQFLKIITEFWPQILANEGCLDPAERRDRLLSMQAQFWYDHPTDSPVVVAGSTGSIPGTAALMKAVLDLSQGVLILPALDLECDETTWTAIGNDPSHPQFGLAKLLADLRAERSSVRVWNDQVPHDAIRSRSRLINEAMRPASTTEYWRRIAEYASEVTSVAADNVRRIDCANAREEAGVISLLLREALEVPGKTAALVTSDRSLARRVKTELSRWDLDIDDTAGEPIRRIPSISLMQLLGEVAREHAAPVPLLAALKHPLTAGGLSSAAFKRRVRELEYLVLRGPRPAPGMKGLVEAAKAAEKTNAEFLGWLDGLAELFAPFLDICNGREVRFEACLVAHVKLAEALAANDQQPGPERLWAGDAGEQANAMIGDLHDGATGFELFDGSAYANLFEALTLTKTYRPRFGGHPRISILGPLEARLHRADLMILGGLNDGVWPPEPTVDAWMSRPMRQKFGLPSPERRIGLSAHDFAVAFTAPEVVLTRADRVEGAPTTPSRWLLRLDTVLSAARIGPLPEDADDQNVKGWQLSLDRSDAATGQGRPAPRPPLKARPRRISVTQVETWMRDPYSIYARHILGLIALDPLDADPGAAERGQIIHKALEKFTEEYAQTLPPNAVEELLRHGRDAFGPALSRPSVWAFWWPRFEHIARWFIAQEIERRPSLSDIFTEQHGVFEQSTPSGPFKLTGYADRIDRRQDGSYEILDYKTGGVPTHGEIEAGLAPQLPLEALILAHGGFEGLTPGPVEGMSYWRLSGGEKPGDIRHLKGDLQELIENAGTGLRDLIDAFDDERTPYLSLPDPSRAPRFNDYLHLARVREWEVDDD